MAQDIQQSFLYTLIAVGLHGYCQLLRKDASPTKADTSTVGRAQARGKPLSAGSGELSLRNPEVVTHFLSQTLEFILGNKG